MSARKIRKFLTAGSVLAGAILGSTAQSAPQSSDLSLATRLQNDTRQGDFVIAPRAKAHVTDDTSPNHQSHASHASHSSHASHQSSYQ